jgi:hypothetical protein
MRLMPAAAPAPVVRLLDAANANDTDAGDRVSRVTIRA